MIDGEPVRGSILPPWLSALPGIDRVRAFSQGLLLAPPPARLQGTRRTRRAGIGNPDDAGKRGADDPRAAEEEGTMKVALTAIALFTGAVLLAHPSPTHAGHDGT